MPNDKLLAKLDEVRALCEKATEGPWAIGDYKDGDARLEQAIDAKGEWHKSRWVYLDKPDAELLAASRTLVPKMERLIRAQARVIEAWRNQKNESPMNHSIGQAESALTQAEKEFVG